MFDLIPNFFSQQECVDAIQEIYYFQSEWKKCNDTDMYILGNSFLRNQTFTYFDSRVQNFNTLELFRKKIEVLFNKEVQFCKKLSKPGFQIIYRNGSNNPCVWHYDTILVRYPYEQEFLNFNNFDSYFEKYYVFGLMLSSQSSTFDYFPETEADYSIIKSGTPLCENHHDLVGDECGNPDCKLTTYKTLQYNQGSLLVQHKKILHRVGINDINGNIENRITLQAYGVVKDNVMYLIW